MKKFVALAYEGLGLDPEGHEIGTARFIDLPPDVFYTICAHRLEDVLWGLYELWKKEDDPEWEEIAATDGFMLYKEWLHLVKHARGYTLPNLKDPDLQKRCDAIIEHYAMQLYNLHRYSPTFDGWRQYVCDASPYFVEKLLIKELPIRIAESDCMRHLFVAASSGSGKSELCKIWCHAYLERPEYGALFVLDPGGDFAIQFVLQARTDRLIYLHPLLDLERTPVINPFEIHGINPKDTSSHALAVKRVFALQLVEALDEVIGEGQKGEVSKNMRTVLHPCILALLDYPNATMRELQLFMDDRRNAGLVSFGTMLTHYEGVADFFQHGFRGETHIKPTKDAIKNKLYSLLTGGIFANLTCGRSTLNLEQAWNDRKAVVFNLPVGDMAQEANAFGRLVVALLQGIAKRRVNIPEEKRIPAHLICDEMEFFLTRSMEEMLRFSRRYKLIFLGVQQIVGSGMSPDMQKAVIGNSYIKIAGWTDPKFAKAAADLLPVREEEIATLSRGEFFIRIGAKPVFKFDIREDYLGSKKRMSDREWERVKAEQLKRYYRPISAPVPVPEVKVPAQEVPAPERMSKVPTQKVLPPQRPPRVRRERVIAYEKEEDVF